MPGQIKGITIEYDATTVKLQTALNKIKAESGQVESELRKVNQNLKFDPKNTDLLATKQGLLKNRIEQARTQLSEFRKVQNQLDAQKVDKTSVEYLKVKRSVAEAEGKIRTFNAQLARMNWQGVKNAGTWIKSTGQQLTQMTRYARLAAGALAGLALFKGFQRLKSLDETSKQLEVLGYRGEKLENIMDSVSGSVDGTRFMLQDMAKVASGALGSGVTDKYSLNDYLKRTADLAQLTGLDVTQMGAMMNKAYSKGKVQAQLMNQFNSRGIPIYKLLQKELGVSADKLQEMSKKGEIGFDDLYKATSRYQGLAQKMGTETLPGAMTVLTQQFGLIGADFLSGVYEPLKEGTQGIVSMIKQMRKDGTFKEWGQDLGDAVKYFVTYFKEGEASMDGLSDRAQNIITVSAPLIKTIGSLVQGFSKLSPQLQSLIVLGTLIGGPVMQGVGTAVTGFANLAMNVQTLVMNAQAGVLPMTGLTQATGALNGVIGLLLNPLTLAAAGTLAWAAGMKKMYDETHMATQSFQEFKAGAEEHIAATESENAVIDTYKAKLDELTSKEKKTAADKALIKTYVDKLNGAVQGLNLKYNEEKDKLNQTSKAIEKKIEKYKQAALAKAYEDEITEAAKEEVKAQKRLEDALEEQKAAREKWEKATDHSRVAQVGFDAQMAESNAKIKDAKKAIKDAHGEMNRWADKAAEASGKVSKNMGKAADGSKKSGKKVTSDFASGIHQSESSVKNAAGAVSKAAANKLDDADTRSAGREFASGFGNGIMSKAGDIASKAASMVKKAISAARKAQDSGSPSKIMRMVGQEYGEGYTLGIGDEIQSASAMSRRMVATSIQAATTPASPAAYSGSQQLAAAGGTSLYIGDININGVQGAEEGINDLIFALQGVVRSK